MRIGYDLHRLVVVRHHLKTFRACSALSRGTLLNLWETGVELLVEGVERTFFLAAQGYYTEWIQRGWITSARDTTVFRPGDAAAG